MVLSLISQEIIGIIQLSIPIIILYSIVPKRFFNYLIIPCSLAMGIFFIFSNYQLTRNTINSLTLIPSGSCMNSFENEVTRCGLNSKNIHLYYRHNGDSIARTGFNTVIIDPMIWKNTEDDPQIPAIKKHLNEVLPNPTLSMLNKIKNMFSLKAQNFFLRHELGHIFHNFSNKYIISLGAIGFLETLGALTIATTAIPVLGGIGAISIGILTGCILDLSLTYLNNVFFKAQEELRADAFAAKFSSQEEIEEVANFFEKYEELFTNDYDEKMGLLAYLSKTIFTGYPSTPARIQHLRKSTQL